MALRASRFFSTRGSAGRVSPRARHRTAHPVVVFCAGPTFPRNCAPDAEVARHSRSRDRPGSGFAPAPAAAGRRAGDPSRTVRSRTRRGGSDRARALAQVRHSARMRAALRDFQTVASWENLGVRFTPRIARGAPPDPRRRRPATRASAPGSAGDLAATSPRAPPPTRAAGARSSPGEPRIFNPAKPPALTHSARERSDQAARSKDARKARGAIDVGEGGRGGRRSPPPPPRPDARSRRERTRGAPRSSASARPDRPARLVRERTPRPNAPGRAPRANRSDRFSNRDARRARQTRRVPPSKTPEEEVFFAPHSCLCLSSPTRSFSSNPAEPNRSNTSPDARAPSPLTLLPPRARSGRSRRRAPPRGGGRPGARTHSGTP